MAKDSDASIPLLALISQLTILVSNKIQSEATSAVRIELRLSNFDLKFSRYFYVSSIWHLI